ncbi:hypothetical protein B0H13DRAFT_2043249, partial [Mycena leptocephala]
MHRVCSEHLMLDVSAFCLSTIEGPMPLLCHLYLVLNEAKPPVIAFRKIPLLRTVALDVPATGAIILSWTQLTSLTSYAAYPEDRAIMQHTSNLIHCDLRLFFDYHVSEHPGPDMMLPQLKSLALNIQSGRRIISRLLLPLPQNHEAISWAKRIWIARILYIQVRLQATHSAHQCPG